jgi:opacity protein-like surface antigen
VPHGAQEEDRNMRRRWLGSSKSGAPGAVLIGMLATAPTFGAGSAQAADDDPEWNAWEITPFVGYMAGGEFEDPLDSTDRDLDADTNFGVIFNATADYWRHYELLYTQQSTTVQGETPLDLDAQYLQIGGIVSNPDARRLIPYLGITVGAAQFSPDDPGLDDETKFAFTVGTGFRIPVTDHIGVRFDARGFFTLFDSDSDIFCVSTGAVGTCRIRTSGSTFFQYAASLGVMVGF